ncbi:hypothetical protein IID62_10420 [candidate division KSB1 bacterium]|nr:hypothetical protein [candidate division KSB1 bacterium]
MKSSNGNNGKKIAIGLLSGGLDSTLAVRVMSDMGYEVTAVNVETPFCNCSGDSKCTTTSKKSNLGSEFKRVYAGQDYIDLVKNPPHGRGKNMNICIDCRIYMLKKAKSKMEEIGAEVVFTGEVLGQRPMSQHSRALKDIEVESGLEGRLLRPLSGKLLKATIPEKEGNISRDKLLDFQGRSRKPQMKLAEEFGISGYPTPAGGCMLTDESFSRRLRDAFDHGEDSIKIVSKLKYGRHFRLEDGTKIISGRTEKENKILQALCDKITPVFTVKGYSSTFTYLFGDMSEKSKMFAGGLTARYSKRRDAGSVDIKWWTGKKGAGSAQVFTVEPLSDNDLNRYRI